MSVMEDILKVQSEAADFVSQLYSIKNRKPGYKESVSEIFDQLHKNGFEYEGLNYNMYKARPEIDGEHPFLRIYALKLENSFIVTGGLIKLVKTLPKDREPLKSELQKLRSIADYIKAAKIQTCYDF